MGILDFLFADPAKLTMPAPDTALPGCPDSMPLPDRHAVLGTPLPAPSPPALARPTSASVVSRAQPLGPPT